MRRTRALVALVRPTFRLLPWLVVSGGGTVAWLLVWLLLRDPSASTGEAITMLRLAAIPLATAVAHGLDDPTEDDLAGAGVGVAARRGVRLALMLPATAGLWWGLVAFAETAPGLAQPYATPLPVVAVTVEASAMLAIALAATVVRSRTAPATPPAFVAPAVLGGLLVLVQLLPERIALTAALEDVRAWRAAHVRWGWFGAAAAAAFVWASRDPCRRPLWRIVHGARPD